VVLYEVEERVTLVCNVGGQIDDNVGVDSEDSDNPKLKTIPDLTYFTAL